MKDIRVFVEVHRRIQGTPPEMAPALQEVWKKLQVFSMADPLSFYELALCFSFPHGYVPHRPWRTRIIGAGFASISKAAGKLEFTIHDIIEIIFKDHLLESRPPKSLPPPATAPSEVTPALPLEVPKARREAKKKNARKA